METIDLFEQIFEEFINIISYPFVRYIFFSFLAWSLFRIIYNSMKVALYPSMTTTKKEDKEEVTAYKFETIEESQYIEQTEIYDPLDPNFFVDPYDDFRG